MSKEVETMKKLLTAVAILLCTGSLALAGPNAGGVLFLHYAPMEVPQDAVYIDGGLTAIGDVVNQAPADIPVMMFAYAAFDAGCGHPRLAAVAFGCNFDIDSTAPLWSATQPGAVEIKFEPDGVLWPYPGSGTSVVFAQALTASVDEVYCFAGYGPEGATWGLVANPDAGGMFADDGNPSLLDDIAGFGSLGFGVPGTTPVPASHVPGSCCFTDGHCELLCESECTGSFLGEGIPCEPNLCPPPPMGACCLPDQTCEVLTEQGCLDVQGTFLGVDVPCVPGETCVIPTEKTSWGQIKNIYR
jgi:hypothetical protein